MDVLNMRSYSPDIDIPRTGWDELAMKDAQVAGTALYVDENGDIWTREGEYVGKVEKGGERVEKQFITAKEIAAALGVSDGKAYAIIRALNAELQEKGYLTIAGKISRTYFNEKWYGMKVG